MLQGPRRVLAGRGHCLPRNNADIPGSILAPGKPPTNPGNAGTVFGDGLYTTERPVFSADTEKYGTAFSAGDSLVCANAPGAFATQVMLALVPAQPGFTRSEHHYSQLVDVRAILGNLVL
jgi:hypothetical protein